ANGNGWGDQGCFGSACRKQPRTQRNNEPTGLFSRSCSSGEIGQGRMDQAALSIGNCFRDPFKTFTRFDLFHPPPSSSTTSAGEDEGGGLNGTKRSNGLHIWNSKNRYESLRSSVASIPRQPGAEGVEPVSWRA